MAINFVCPECFKPYKSTQGSITGPYCDCAIPLYPQTTSGTSMAIPKNHTTGHAEFTNGHEMEGE